MKKDNAKLILEVQGLKKYFTNAGIVNKAVNDVSFNLHEGEIVGLIGESGSGKTTVGRSLLRLYDDFNGFVTLDGKVISGKRISRAQTKFLRKNVQMIFQDPHASLNGQKNIYSTLKEPLVVNGIIKNKIKDILKDWTDIKEMYFYTFQQKYKSLELQNLKSINDLAKEFFAPWVAKLQAWKIDESLSYEDNFNAYYGYLEHKQNMESQIVNNMYYNTDELMNFYFHKQADFRNSNLELDESELKAAKDHYLKTIQLSKMTLKQYNALEKVRVYKQQIKELEQAWKERKVANSNTFTNFIVEFKKDAQIYRNARWVAPKLDIYSHNLKNQLLSLKLNKVTKKLKSELKNLTYQQVRAVIEQLQEYSKHFFTEHLLALNYTPKLKEQIKEVIEQKFDFCFEEWTKVDAQNFKHYLDSLSQLREQIHANENIPVANHKFASQEDIAKAKQAYDKALQVNKQMLEQYIVEHNEKIAQLSELVDQEQNRYYELKNLQTQANALVEQAHKTFIAFLHAEFNKLKQNNASKQELSEHSKLIKLYTTKVKSKQATLKSFQIEAKYLKRDVRAIKVLLGIDTARAADSKAVKIAKKLSGNFIARFLITNLLIKTTIYKSLEDVGLLKQFAFRYPHEFSGGQRQRIVIARALITQPKVIVADEPIASLDISIQAQVVNLLKDLCEKKNIGMIFIAHDLSMIEYIADRVEIMHYGKVVESGDTEKVYAKPIHPYTINLFKAIPKISNANEKFENISFELDYFKGQQYPNVPELFQVEPEHFIYGTASQAEQWAAPFNLKVAKIGAKEHNFDCEQTNLYPWEFKGQNA
ncbi:ATP-binding cassette domain-containing protein [Mycoplasma simbae]|uniref:ATP-binding cassette domain-containing protein n=1 Tax=Mycoplasma simbae TaxID=36744 RepID=UPI00069128F2|nr:ATP-binding cassette domain-containing protein [Mycoplasma simbae]